MTERADVVDVSGTRGIRGRRLGAGPSQEVDRGGQTARRTVTYYCSQGHRSVVPFAADACPPATWDCPRCGRPAGQDPATPPPVPERTPYKTHLTYVKERRSEEEGAALLDEALTLLRQRRASGEIVL